MPKNTTLLAGAALALGLFASAAAGAFAQATPAPSPAMKPAPAASPTATPAPTPSPTPFKLLGLSGAFDAGYETMGGTSAARFVNGNPSRVFDGSQGPFFDENGGRQVGPANDDLNKLDLQNANVSLNINGSVFSGKIEGSFGTDANVIASNGQTRANSNLTQAYFQAIEGPATFQAGKIETIAGAEVIEAPGNSNYSRSYLFGYAIPFTHTGVRVTYAATPKVTVIVGANNGWDDWKFAGKKKTLEGALELAPSPAIAWTIDTYNGNDFAVNGNSALFMAPVLTNRMLYDTVLTVHATSALTLIANYDNGTQLADSGAFFPMTAHWNGVAGYANYAFNSVYGISLRKESFNDIDGFRTGLPGGVVLQSNTATFNYTPGSNYIFRLEYREDAADKNAFTYTGAGPNGRAHQTSLGIEAIVKFP